MKRLRVVPKALALLAFALPLLLLLTGSFRTNSEMFRYAGELSWFSLVPAEPTLDAYRRIGELPLFFRQLANTVILGLFMATATTIVSALAAYPLARIPFRGRSGLFFLMLATLFIPVDVVLPPLFFVVRDLSLIDDFWGLALPFVFAPMGVYLLRQAMLEVPMELDQAATLDGAGPLEVLRTCILPNIKPALVATWLIHFVFVWEWYLWPITIMRRDDGQLAQVAISGLVDPLRASDYALVFAAAVVTVLPAFVVFALLQRFLTATNATSGGK